MRWPCVMLRSGAVLGALTVLPGSALATEGVVSPNYVYATALLAAVITATAAFITWIEKKIDVRVAEKIEPVKVQVQALYTHFLGDK